MLFADGVAGDGHHRAVLEVPHDCLTETLDYMVSSGKLAPGLAIEVLVQFDKVC
jgi:hypothetical protein